MSAKEFIYRFIVSKSLTLFYSSLLLLTFMLEYVKNFFQSPWAQKLRLEPPGPLSDPKYGVHKYIKVNNIKLHYVESGDPSKPLMLFLHGFPEFWYSWRYQIVEFNKDYRCVAVDLRGYGDSERPEGVDQYHIDLLIEDVRDLVRQLGAEKCIVVSHDWGGLIACRFRDVYPEVVRACVVLGSTSREAWLHELWNNPKQRAMSWYVFAFQMPSLPEMMVLMNDMKMYDISMLVSGKTATGQQDIECYKYWFGKPYSLTPPINYYRANFPLSLPAKNVKGDIPMLAAHGENDNFLNHNLLEIMKTEYPKLETTILKNVGHFMQQEEPELVNKLIREFLSKNYL